MSVCATLGEDPIIRYQVTENDDPDDHRPRAPPATRQLANILQNEIDDFCRLNRNFPVSIAIAICIFISIYR